VQNAPSSNVSPTDGPDCWGGDQMAAVLLAYAFNHISSPGLRKLQSEMWIETGKDSLKLLRFQNDLQFHRAGKGGTCGHTEPYTRRRVDRRSATHSQGPGHRLEAGKRAWLGKPHSGTAAVSFASWWCAVLGRCKRWFALAQERPRRQSRGNRFACRSKHAQALKHGLFHGAGGK